MTCKNAIEFNHHGGHRRHTAAMGPQSGQQIIQQSTSMLCGRSTSLKLEKNVFITSDNTINARRVDDDNARTIASLASSPPVVSGVAITSATMAPSSSASTTSSLVAGTASRSASTDDGTPPATSSSAMADDDDDDNDDDDDADRGVESVPSRHWRFFVSPVVVCVRPPPLPSFHPPSPPLPPLAPSPRRLPRVVACLRR